MCMRFSHTRVLYFIFIHLTDTRSTSTSVEFPNLNPFLSFWFFLAKSFVLTTVPGCRCRRPARERTGRRGRVLLLVELLPQAVQRHDEHNGGGRGQERHDCEDVTSLIQYKKSINLKIAVLVLVSDGSGRVNIGILIYCRV